MRTFPFWTVPFVNVRTVAFRMRMASALAVTAATPNAARLQFGVEDKVGPSSVGKSAGLVLFDQHPLLNYSKALKVWIDGHEYFDRDKDLETRPKFQDERKKLLEKENAERPNGNRDRTRQTAGPLGAREESK